MADDSRSPGLCPWDPGEDCKVRACLPPRKRLLAGLKQNGWLSSSSSYLQGCNGAGLMEELKLEVDLAEANLDDNGDTCLVESTAGKQGECNAVESPVSVKSKKASRRRKSLSVLADCHGSVNKLQPESLKSGSGGKIEKKFRTNKASMESLSASTGEKESAPSYREIVDAARAAAAIAAKAAAEARAIALDKAAAAAKAAAVAKAALEALALAAYDDEEWGFQSSKHIRALCKHKRKGDKLKQELKPEFPLRLTEGVNAISEKRVEERMGICSTPLDESKEDEHTQISHVASSPVGMGAGWHNIKEDKRTEAHQFLIVDLASDRIKEDDQSHFNHVTSPPPPPLDDEKLARQLHRAMNSSPRISRYRAPLECSEKLETAPFSTQGCIQNKHLQAGGCNLSKERKSIHKEKTRVPRASIGRADVKVKSMSAINETLNMLQGASPCKYRVLGGISAASEEHSDSMCVKEDLSLPTISSHALASLIKCNEEGDKLTVNGDDVSSCEFDVEARSKKASFSSYPLEPGMGDELRAIKWAETIKKRKSSSKIRTGGSLIAASHVTIPFSLQSRDSNGIGEVPAMSSYNHSATFYNAISEPTGSHLEPSKDYGKVGRDENQGRVNVPRVAGDNIKETSTVRNTQENSFRDKSSRVTRKSSPISSHGERHTRRQKVLGVLSNGLSKGNQNFGGSLNLSSPTVS